MRPFRCPVTILNTIDHLGKFDGKVDEGFFVGYSLNSKAFRVFNSRTRIVEENLHIRFSESTPNTVYSLIILQTTDPPYSQDPKSSHDDGSKPSSDDEKVDKDPRKDSGCNDQEKEDNVNITNNVNAASTNKVNIVGGKTSIELPFDPNMPALEDYSIFDFSRNDEDDGAKADMNNLDTTIQVNPNPTTRIHKDHSLDQVIEDLQSATQTRKMSKNLKEHGFVSTIQQRTNHKDPENCLFACFLSQEEPKKVIRALKDSSWIKAMQEDLLQFKLQEVWTLVDLPNRKRDIGTKSKISLKEYTRVEKALSGLHQAPRALYETLSTHLLDNGFQKGKIDKTLFIKRHKGDIFLVQVYVDDIIFGSAKKELCFAFEKSMISSLMYLTSLIPDIMFAACDCARYQVNPKVSHLHAAKRIFRYLKGQPKLGLWYPKDSPFDLVAYTDSDYAGASLDRKSTTGGCQFLGCRLISWQCKKQTVVANSITEAKYVAASSCCRQVLWIQNQLLDYGYNFMHAKIFIDNNTMQSNTLRSDEDRLKHDDMMALIEAAQVSTIATTVTITTKEITLAQALEALRTSKPKVKGIVFQEPGKSTTTTTISSQQSQDKGKGIMIEEPVKPMKNKDQISYDEVSSFKYKLNFDKKERHAREKDEKEKEAI
ncbi:putative ribonuclease H-like domain-containing protein [Tanacetum coccineum]